MERGEWQRGETVGVYVIAQLRFTDEARYRKYQEEFPAVFARSGGRVLAADESPTVLEGDWGGNKVVLLEFPDEGVARNSCHVPRRQALHARQAAHTAAGSRASRRRPARELHSA
jgi:uncharacterized protein (DUF1330 family)